MGGEVGTVEDADLTVGAEAGISRGCGAEGVVAASAQVGNTEGADVGKMVGADGVEAGAQMLAMQ